MREENARGVSGTQGESAVHGPAPRDLGGGREIGGDSGCGEAEMSSMKASARSVRSRLKDASGDVARFESLRCVWVGRIIGARSEDADCEVTFCCVLI